MRRHLHLSRCKRLPSVEGDEKRRYDIQNRVDQSMIPVMAVVIQQCWPTEYLSRPKFYAGLSNPQCTLCSILQCVRFHSCLTYFTIIQNRVISEKYGPKRTSTFKNWSLQSLWWVDQHFQFSSTCPPLLHHRVVWIQRSLTIVLCLISKMCLKRSGEQSVRESRQTWHAFSNSSSRPSRQKTNSTNICYWHKLTFV